MKLTARNALAYRTYVRTKEDEERRSKIKKNYSCYSRLILNLIFQLSGVQSIQALRHCDTAIHPFSVVQFVEQDVNK